MHRQIRHGTIVRRSTPREKVTQWVANNLASVLEDLQGQVDALAAADVGDVRAFAAKAAGSGQKVRQAIAKLRKAMT